MNKHLSMQYWYGVLSGVMFLLALNIGVVHNDIPWALITGCMWGLSSRLASAGRVRAFTHFQEKVVECSRVLMDNHVEDIISAIDNVFLDEEEEEKKEEKEEEEKKDL